jgi:hypothetical protein
MRYPTDRVPQHIRLKLRHREGHASTRCHMPCGPKPHLLAEVGSGITTCHVAPDLASLPGWVLVLPRVSSL